MEIRKILWPTDFSKNSEDALPYVTSLSQKYDAEIHILYVGEDLSHHEAWYGEFETTHIPKIREWEDKMAEKRLEDICSNHLEGCPRFIRHIRVGDPAQEILRTIGSEGVDIVVMATHGMKGHFPFGSVTERVVKNSPVPVLTISSQKQEAQE